MPLPDPVIESLSGMQSSGRCPDRCIAVRVQETGLTLETACEYLRLTTQLQRSHASIQPLLEAGGRRLHASFAELDGVWAAEEMQRLFVGLPIEAVQAWHLTPAYPVLCVRYILTTNTPCGWLQVNATL